DLYIVDRKKDMFISGGENVYPVEVEQVLIRHPKVSELAIVGVPDEHWGEVGILVVVPRAGEDVTLPEIAAFCEGKLAHFKVPRRIAVVDALPRNATGKRLKHELPRQYGAASATAKG
ncbi:class I adenylate-forming enzyme family protein, partial [Acidiphilium sp.]|uniref:class I adenylate-forming enzyme family protein n=1 Tax=Acidiphilium sp. TaxID=527 RepID=UPI0038CFB281